MRSVLEIDYIHRKWRGICSYAHHWTRSIFRCICIYICICICIFIFRLHTEEMAGYLLLCTSLDQKYILFILVLVHVFVFVYVFVFIFVLDYNHKKWLGVCCYYAHHWTKCIFHLYFICSCICICLNVFVSDHIQRKCWYLLLCTSLNQKHFWMDLHLLGWVKDLAFYYWGSKLYVSPWRENYDFPCQVQMF